MDPRHILIVDDEPAIRRTVGRLVSESGYDHETSDGAEALALVRTAPLPCILITGFAPDELTARALTPACGVLTKPLYGDTFLAELRRCLRQRH